MPPSIQNTLVGVGIAAFLVFWSVMFFGMLWKGFIWPLLKLLKKLVVLLWDYPSAMPLIAVNLIPLVGVLAFDWKVFEVLLLYWVEVAVYCFFSVKKLRTVLAHTRPEHLPHIRIIPFAIRRSRGESSEDVMRRIVPDFVKTFAIFAVLALVFIVLISGISGERSLTGQQTLHFSWVFLDAPLALFFNTLIAAISFSLSHGYSYKRNFLGKEEFRSITLREQLSAPLDRLGTMWVAIFVGIIFGLPFGTPLAALVIVIFLKTATDVYAHIKEHAKLTKHSLPAISPIGNSANTTP